MLIDYRKSLTNTLLENTTYPQDIINIIVKKVIDDKYTLDFCKTEKYRVYNLLRLVNMGMIENNKLQEINEYQQFLNNKIDELE
jgi:hypothetical protein